MINKLKKIKIEDIIGIFKFIIVLIPALLKKVYLKLLKKELWLICEMRHIARDNGYYLFKYLKDNNKPECIFYAIDKKSKDYSKLKQYDKSIVQWGSLKHYYLFMSATKNISSNKNGNPNHPLFSLLLLYFNMYNNRIFLQHGILFQNFEMFHKKNSKFKLFITGAEPEYKFVKSKYGYDNEVKYTGLARFDGLHDFDVDSQYLLYMPTWRRWFDNESEFINSYYFKKINSVLNSCKLQKILEKYNKILLFCPHEGLYKYNKFFKTNNENVKILNILDVDVQDLLKKTALLITDFSSIHTDFAYMKKPIIYYQYDENDYHERHVGKIWRDTYYNYLRDGFGKITNTEDMLLDELENIIKNNLTMDKVYRERCEKFFLLHDNKNCERIYEEILKCGGKND